MNIKEARIWKEKKESKDQTYFLWTLTQENLSRTIFPLGELTKPEVRKIALEHGHEKLSKKVESQEICFIPENDYRTFLAEHVENYVKTYGPGYFTDTSGKRLGMHKGFPNYTIGQRKGLGIALGQPMFVVAIHPEDNTVVLGTKDELQGKTFFVRDVNLTSSVKDTVLYQFNCQKNRTSLSPSSFNRVLIRSPQPAVCYLPLFKTQLKLIYQQ